MKCKSFKIQLQEDAGNLAEVKLNKFLENLNVSRVFASIVNNEFWSVMVFYGDDVSAVAQTLAQKQENAATNIEENLAPKTASKKAVSAPEEPICLSAKEEEIFAALREWRNELAARDGLPPYMIAHNDSLKAMAKFKPKSFEELVNIKGFGEKRAQKYGDELIELLAAQEQTAE